MPKAGDISVSLVLDGAGNFETQLYKASQKLDAIAGSSSRLNKEQEKGAQRTTEWTGKLRDFAVILGLARSALENVSSVLFSLPKVILEQNALIERNTALIEGMSVASMGLAEAQRYAAQEVENLIDISSQSPYTLQAVMDSYTKLRVGGIENTENSLKALINTSAKFGSTSEQLKRGSIAIQQMLGKGVISMEELRQQLGEAIPDIMGIMARALNVSMRDMVKAISTGTVEAKSAVKLMFNEMAFSSMGAAERMAETWDGLLNQIKNQATVLAKEVGDAGFFNEMKDIAREIIDMMGSGGLDQGVRNLSDAMSVAARGGFELAKSLAENLKLIGAIVAALASSKLVQIGAGFAAQGAKMVADHKQYSRQIIQDLTKQKEAYANIDSEAWDKTNKLAREGKLKNLNQLELYYRTEKQIMEKGYQENIDRLERLNQKVNSTAGKIKGAGRAMVNAMGGWTNVAVIGITALLYALDELIWKQERAAKNIIENNGSNTNVEVYKDAIKELDDYDEKIQAAKKSIDDLKSAPALSNSQLGRVADTSFANSNTQLAAAQNKLKQLEAQRAELDKNLQRSQRSIFQAASEYGGSSALRMISGDLREVAAEYEKTSKEIQAQNLNVEQNILERQKARQTALDSVKQVIDEEVNNWSSKIETLNAKNDGIELAKWSIDDQNKMKAAEGAIKALQTEYEKLKSSIDNGTFVRLTGSTDKWSKSMASLSLKLGTLVSKNKALTDGIADQSIEMKVMQMVATGAYGKLSEGQEKTIIALAKEIDNQKALNSEIKKNIQLRQQAEVRLGNNLAQMSKKLGTSLAKSDNPFLSWQKSSYQTKELVVQIREQLEATGEPITEAHKKSLEELETYQKQIDANNIKNSLLKEQERLHIATLTPLQKEQYLYDKQKTHLKELGDELDKITDPSKRAELKALLDTVSKSTDADKESKNPFAKWLKSSQELEEQVSTRLVDTMNGAIDGFIDSMVDSESSFSDIMDNMTKALSKFLIKLMVMKSLEAAFGMGGSTPSVDKTPSLSSGAFQNPPANFANGGIMTPWGSAPLRKYAEGGIATSPQVAVFGEGAHNEAYVPLPDGRTIPVTMAGGGAPRTTVNVINQTGTQAEAESSEPYFDGEKYVIDVVMKAAARPGKFRTMMQGVQK